MPKVKIEYERDVCIGTAACAPADPAHFEMLEDGKSSLKGGEEKEPQKYVLETELTEEELKKTMAAAQACPVNAIHVTVDGEKRI